MNTTQTRVGTVGTVGREYPHNSPSPYAQESRSGESVPTVPTVPNEAADLVEECRLIGVELWVEGDRLRYRGPSGFVCSELVEAIRTHKAAILALIIEPSPFAERWGPSLDHDEPSIHTRHRLTDPALAWGELRAE